MAAGAGRLSASGRITRHPPRPRRGARDARPPESWPAPVGTRPGMTVLRSALFNGFFFVSTFLLGLARHACPADRASRVLGFARARGRGWSWPPCARSAAFASR